MTIITGAQCAAIVSIFLIVWLIAYTIMKRSEKRHAEETLAHGLELDRLHQERQAQEERDRKARAEYHAERFARQQERDRLAREEMDEELSFRPPTRTTL